MSYADDIFIQTCRTILDSGTYDTDLPVRPRWADVPTALGLAFI